MKKIAIIIFCLNAGIAFAQKGNELKPTRSFLISGEVKTPVNVTLDDLKKYKEASIGDVLTGNHPGEKKIEAKGMKGILLKDVISSAEINAENPKVLSEYYFVFKATDGYVVVYSWNELYNTVTGDASWIVTEKDGKPASELKDAIQIISPKDFSTARRSVYCLASIEVKRAR